MEHEKVIKTNCTMCINSCGMNVRVKDGKIADVEGMTEHPYSKGYLCPRGETIIDWQYSPNRLLYPQKRDGREWKRITWDEALDTIVNKLKEIKEEYGTRAFALTGGSLAVDDRECTAMMQRFRGVYGTPNFVNQGICYDDLVKGRLLTFGRLVTEEPKGAKCIIVWGTNPDASNPPRAANIREAVEQGAKLIVIDTIRTGIAKEGIHLQPRPGTDLALALAMLNVIVGEDLYDKEFIESWTIGFERLKKHVEHYPPEKAEEITRVPASEIRKVARIYAESKPSCIVNGLCALGQQRNGVQNHRVFSILQAVTGNVYLPGTWVRTPFLRFSRSRVEVEEAPIGVDRYPLFYELWGRIFGMGQGMSLPDVILTEKPYAIKSLMIIAGNPVVNQPEVEKFKRAFKKLDFIVVMDVRMNETAQLADLVLPSATFLEKTGLGYTYGPIQGVPFVMLRKKVVEPPEECWSEFKFFTELGRRMGFSNQFSWKTEEEFVDHELTDAGLSVKQLTEEKPSGILYASTEYGDKAYSKNGFPTPSHKIELYSDTLEKAGHDPMPTYAEPTESPINTPELAKEYPLILITGNRILEYQHGQLRDIPRLREKIPEAVMEIHPETASKYGVQNGEMANLETKKGSIRIRVKTNVDVLSEVVSIPHGWVEANPNALTDLELRDPIIGIAQLSAIQCKLGKA